MPSRQSCSKAMGSSPRAMRRSLSTSRASSKERSGLSPVSRWLSKLPEASPLAWRQIWKVSDREEAISGRSELRG